MVLEHLEIVIDPAWCREGAVIPEEVELSEAWYEAFIEANPGCKVELLRNGKVIRRMNAPFSSLVHVELVHLLRLWMDSGGSGFCGESSLDLWVPPRGVRRADGSWFAAHRMPPPSAWSKPLRIPPDFAFEVVSPSQQGRLGPLDEKMREYMDWGVRLAWLIDPHTRQVRIYRANGSVEDLDEPVELSGEDVMPGFTVPMSDVWNPQGVV